MLWCENRRLLHSVLWNILRSESLANDSCQYKGEVPILRAFKDLWSLWAFFVSAIIRSLRLGGDLFVSRNDCLHSERSAIVAVAKFIEDFFHRPTDLSTARLLGALSKASQCLQAWRALSLPAHSCPRWKKATDPVRTVIFASPSSSWPPSWGELSLSLSFRCKNSTRQTFKSLSQFLHQ